MLHRAHRDAMLTTIAPEFFHATQPAALWVWRAGFEERYHGLYSAGPVWSTAVLEVPVLCLCLLTLVQLLRARPSRHGG